MAPPSASAGHGLLSLLHESPVFSFSGTGGIYFLCHFGGCLPCQRLFCRVEKDKKVVSRLFGGGREDCLVRERGALRSQQTHAALPLRPPLRETLGTRPVHARTSPAPAFLGYVCSWGHTVLVTRGCSCARAWICLSWNLGNAADECSNPTSRLQISMCSCNSKSPFFRTCGKKARQEPRPGCPCRWENAAVIWQPPRFRQHLLSGGSRELASPGRSHGASPEDAQLLPSVSIPGTPMPRSALGRFSSAPPDPTPTPHPGTL